MASPLRLAILAHPDRSPTAVQHLAESTQPLLRHRSVSPESHAARAAPAGPAAVRGIRLDALHEVIQFASGRADHHLWVFDTPRVRSRAGPACRGRKVLATTAARTGSRLRHTYRRGDGREHDVLVEAVVVAEPGVCLPRCLIGRRAGPPEDCGGPWGYAELDELLADGGRARPGAPVAE